MKQEQVLVISTSLRPTSNSDALAEAFAEGAASVGHKVEKLTLRGKNIAFCRGCMACGKLGHCAISDDAIAMAEKIKAADVVCFATPVYYYGMSGQMKTLLDRCNSLYYSDYQFRDIYLLTSAAEDEPSTPQRTIEGLKGWIDCFDKARSAGSVFAGGVDDPGSIQGHEALQCAYRLGASISE